MPYLMGGFPDLEGSRAVAEAYADAGADLVELGIPFSDPLADGPVIHAAATAALAAGASFEGVMSVCAAISDRVPVVPMCYSNMIFARGPEAFATVLASAGAAGAIVPDLPPEEAGTIGAALGAAGLALVPLIAPTTPAERRRAICAQATGFIYLVSDTRVTGERDSLPPGLAELIAAVRADAELPVAVGFGIGTPEQARAVGASADGVIIGTRLVRAVAEASDAESAAGAVATFVRDAREAMAAGHPIE
ncbi:MAG: tryptophan synthase alpha chain [Solirubrobacterales bacterium]|nr:tryptophan synthase alpha chain [Solirubrobacterales bacterium]